MSEKKVNRGFSIFMGGAALVSLAYLLFFVPHEVLGHLITMILTVLACFACVVAILVMANFYLNGPGYQAQVDRVGSQFVGQDGRYDFSQGDENSIHEEWNRIPFEDKKRIIGEPDYEPAIDDAGEEEGPDDFPEEPANDAPMIEFSVPDYTILKGVAGPKILKPKI